MKSVKLFNTPIRIDDDGMVCLTDMWLIAKTRAESGDDRFLCGRDIDSIRPYKFTRLESTVLFISELSKWDLKSHLKTIRGKSGGTYASRYLAYEYAGHIDPAFKVGVYTVLDKFFSGELVSMAGLIAEAHIADRNFEEAAEIVSDSARAMSHWGVGGQKQYFHHKRQEAYARLKIEIPDLPVQKIRKFLPEISQDYGVPVINTVDHDALRLELMLLNQESLARQRFSRRKLI